jgi:hypothetical protein
MDGFKNTANLLNKLANNNNCFMRTLGTYYR